MEGVYIERDEREGRERGGREEGLKKEEVGERETERQIYRQNLSFSLGQKKGNGASDLYRCLFIHESELGVHEGRN